MTTTDYTHGPDHETTVDERNESNRRRARKLGRPDTEMDAETPQLVEKFAYRRSETGADRCYLHGNQIAAKPDGKADWHLEHVEPLVLGGGHTVQNLEVACSTCNLAKGSKTLEHYLGPKDAAIRIRWLEQNKVEPTSRRKQPAADLWQADCDPSSDAAGGLARRWSAKPRPRPGQPAGVANWKTRGANDVSIEDTAVHSLIMRVLLDKPDPYSAMTLTEISDASPRHRRDGRPNKYGNALWWNWELCFGMCGRQRITKPHLYWDKMYKPSPWIVPVNLPTRPGAPLTPGFRIRFGVQLEQRSDQLDRPTFVITGTKPTDARYPELDDHVLSGLEAPPEIQ